jgi:phosphoglycerate dehydrogenase-like enzyme
LGDDGVIMTKRTLVINLKLEESLVRTIKQFLPDWNIVAANESVLLTDDLKQAEIILHWSQKIEPLVLEENKNVKWLQTWTAGIDSLPLPELQQKGIYVTSANGVHAYPISETIFALILSLTRKIHTYVRQQQEKKWYHARLNQEIHHQTIGIIGVGAIGLETAKIAKAFGMQVLGVRHSGKVTDYVDKMYKPDQLDEVLPQCDVVVITLPLTNETTYMFAKDQFKQMKDTAILINIGRGPIIKEDDLIQALQQHEIAGAGLDVFITEPLPEDSPLWEMEQVIITPHTAGSTKHYDERVIKDIFLPNLKRYLQGEIPHINLVDYEKGY